MIKTSPPGSQDFGESVSYLLKIANDGRIYCNDLSDFIKRAGHPFAKVAKEIHWQKGEVPIHLLALGATEAFGLNRNFDGFKEAACKRYHKTFEKLARLYSSHINRDPKKSYGVVKKAYYNEPLKRIELLVALNGTKEAADRNGGLLASDILNDLESGKELAVSMSCRVPFDVCTYCHNKAANRKEYCESIDEGGTCKAGGLKKNAGKVLESGLVLGMDNPHPSWFDISHVKRGADRTAFVFGKVASGHIRCGAELAEELGITAPLDVVLSQYDSYSAEYVKCAYVLAHAEADIETDPFRTQQYSRAFDQSAQNPIENIEQIAPNQRSSYFSALANEKIALSLTDFIRLSTGYNLQKSAKIASEAKIYLPGVFNRLIADELVDNEIAQITNLYQNSSTSHFKQAAVELAEDYSIDEKYVNKRIYRSVIRNPENQPSLVKVAHKQPESRNEQYLEKLARQYALYKVALLKQIVKSGANVRLMSDLLVRQNYVSN